MRTAVTKITAQTGSQVYWDGSTVLEVTCKEGMASHLLLGGGLKWGPFSARKEWKGPEGRGGTLEMRSSIASHTCQAPWASTSLNLHHWATLTFLRTPVSTRGRVKTGWGSVALAITTEWPVILMMGKHDEHIFFQPQSCVHARTHKQVLMNSSNHLLLYYYSKGYVSMPSFFLFFHIKLFQETEHLSKVFASILRDCAILLMSSLKMIPCS